MVSCRQIAPELDHCLDLTRESLQELLSAANHIAEVANA